MINIEESEENIFINIDHLEKNQLKVTENGRYLWTYEEKSKEKKTRIRVSFSIKVINERMLSTEHGKVVQNNDGRFKISICVKQNDFHLTAGGIKRLKYSEKEKGINLQCVIDLLEKSQQ